MVGEVGELCEIFQWKGEVEPGLPGWSDKDRVHLGEEMSDVFMCEAIPANCDTGSNRPMLAAEELPPLSQVPDSTCG